MAMPYRAYALSRIIIAATITVLFSACAAGNDPSTPDQSDSCPIGELWVCEGGTISKTGRVRDREPRVCQCRPQDQLAF